MQPDVTPSPGEDGPAHLRHHLGVRLEIDLEGRPVATMPLLPQHRTRHGAVSAGAVATLVDLAAGQASGGEGVGPAVTSHLALRLPPPEPCARLVARPRVARAGRTSVVNVVRVTNPDRGTTIAAATVTFTVLPGTGGSHVPGAGLEVPSVWTDADRVAVDVTTDEFVGVRRRRVDAAGGPARYAMDLATHLRNVNGVLHGGGLVLFTEHAALLAAEDAGVPRSVVDEIDVHFLAPATTGPVVGTATTIGAPSDRSRLTMLVEATDEGQNGRRVGVGLVGVAEG